MNSTSSNIFKAKKLVEKAKAVQHNRISRTVEEAFHISLRRSSRQRALAEKKHLEKIEVSLLRSLIYVIIILLLKLTEMFPVEFEIT